MDAYNPLETRNIGESVIRRLLSSDASLLENIQKFTGAGIYVIYYAGDYKPYLSYKNDSTTGVFDRPIYIGKAIPAGARIGGTGSTTTPTYVLYNRLKEHLESINQATNLSSGDFYFRSLVVDDIWIPLAESILIGEYLPIWNVQIAGFGNHDPGSGRYQQRRSLWDTLHPGRPWATKCQSASQNADQILASLKLNVPETFDMD